MLLMITMMMQRFIVVQPKLMLRFSHPNPSLSRGKDQFLLGVYVETVATCPWRWRKCAAGKKKNCDAKKPRFKKLCLDPDYLELSIKSSADIRNDRQNNNTKTFRKAAYRHYILDKHGYLGKGRRKVAPSCVVWEIREHYPSSTGIYMGFKER